MCDSRLEKTPSPPPSRDEKILSLPPRREDSFSPAPRGEDSFSPPPWGEDKPLHRRHARQASCYFSQQVLCHTCTLSTLSTGKLSSGLISTMPPIVQFPICIGQLDPHLKIPKREGYKSTRSATQLILQIRDVDRDGSTQWRYAAARYPPHPPFSHQMISSSCSRRPNLLLLGVS